jgi:hypothetical protein
MELLRTGEVWNIYWDAEKKHYVIKSDNYDDVYSFGRKKPMIDTYFLLETNAKRHMKINKNSCK